MYYIAV